MVVCIDDERHKLSDSSKVCFSEVQGMTELNSLGPVEIKVRGPYSAVVKLRPFLLPLDASKMNILVWLKFVSSIRRPSLLQYL